MPRNPHVERLLADPESAPMLLDLAERLAAAFISHKLALGMDYALKKYVRPGGREKLGDLWIALAARVMVDGSVWAGAPPPPSEVTH